MFYDWNLELEFKYDSKYGKLVIPSQDMYSPEYWDSQSGYVVQVLDGYDAYKKEKTYEDVGDDIATMFLNKQDALEFKSLSVKYPDNPYLFRAVYDINAGAYLGYYQYAWMGVEAPRTDPSEAYMAWGGNWKLGDNVITIAPVENSATEYTITGLHPGIDATFYAYYNMNTGNVDIYGYQDANKEYSKDGHKYHYYLVGVPDAENTEWITGDKLASFVKNEDGTITVEAGICSFDNETPYAKFGVVGNFTDIWDWDGENAVLYDLPNTLEKADAAVSVASVKQNKVELKAAPAAAKSSTKSVKKERPMTLKEFRARLAK